MNLRTFRMNVMPQSSCLEVRRKGGRNFLQSVSKFLTDSTRHSSPLLASISILYHVGHYECFKFTFFCSLFTFIYNALFSCLIAIFSSNTNIVGESVPCWLYWHDYNALQNRHSPVSLTLYLAGPLLHISFLIYCKPYSCGYRTKQLPAWFKPVVTSLLAE